MEWMILPLKRYAEFGGRSRRMEFWMFTLFTILVGIVANALDIALLNVGWDDTGPIDALTSLALLIPSIAVGVRRLHDTGRSGWWYLLIFAVIIGWIFLLVWYCTDGEPMENEYGPDPKGQIDVGVFE